MATFHFSKLDFWIMHPSTIRAYLFINDITTYLSKTGFGH